MHRERSLRVTPMFVSPSRLDFYSLSPSTHKQLVRIYNISGIPVKYEASVAPNSLKHYAISHHTGVISPNHTKDVAVQHRSPTSASYAFKDNLRILVRDVINSAILAEKIVPLRLLPGELEKEHISRDTERPRDGLRQYGREFSPERRWHQNSALYILIIALGLCVLLFLPTEREPPVESIIPVYLHVRESVKIVIGFIVGVLSMILARDS